MLHARNLFEFAAKENSEKFTLHALGGLPKRNEQWAQWANNRVTHMLEREHDKAPWPDGLDNNRPDRLMVMAKAVLDVLEAGGKSISEASIRVAYDEVLSAAQRYWLDPTEETHAALAELYDSSRDDAAPPY